MHTRTKQPIVSALVAAVVAATAFAAAPAGAQQPAWSAQTFAVVDSFVSSTMRRFGVPGAQLAIVTRDGTVHARAFGRADDTGRPVTFETPFRIGSNTKAITDLAIMQLAEQGKLDVNAPVVRYIPWFRMADSAASRITVAQLMYHTSGIPSWANFAVFRQPRATLEDFVHELSSVPLDRPVGSAYEYANANYSVLGLAIEKVSGQAYGEYVRRHILNPLQMTHTTVSAEEERRGGLPQGYEWYFGYPHAANDPFSAAFLPAGYLSSTVVDLSHYLIALLNGGRYGSAQILSPEGIAKMHEPGLNTAMSVSSVAGAPHYGMGWGIVELGADTVLTHDGATWAFHSTLFVNKRQGWGMILLTNADNQLSSSYVFRALKDGVLVRLGEPVKLAGPSMRALYVAVDILLLLLSTGIVWAVVRLARWNTAVRARRAAARRPWRTALTIARIAMELLAPLTILTAQSFTHLPLKIILWAVPDVAWWSIVASLVLFVLGLAHGALFLRSLEFQRRVGNGDDGVRVLPARQSVGHPVPARAANA